MLLGINKLCLLFGSSKEIAVLLDYLNRQAFLFTPCLLFIYSLNNVSLSFFSTMLPYCLESYLIWLKKGWIKMVHIYRDSFIISLRSAGFFLNSSFKPHSIFGPIKSFKQWALCKCLAVAVMKSGKAYSDREGSLPAHFYQRTSENSLKLMVLNKSREGEVNWPHTMQKQQACLSCRGFYQLLTLIRWHSKPKSPLLKDLQKASSNNVVSVGFAAVTLVTLHDHFSV